MIWVKRISKVILTLVLSIVFFLMLLYRNDISQEEVNQKYATPQSHFINVNGQNVHVRIMGQGEPILLLHGSFSSLHTWEDWQELLSPYFMTISLDFPGHGLTGPDELQRYSIQDYSHLALTLAENLGLDKFHVAGNSMGGAVALQMASTRPDKVLSLNLIDASGAPIPSTRNLDDEGEDKKNTGLIFKLTSNPIFSKLLLKCTPKFLFAMNMKEVYFNPDKITNDKIDRYYELMLRDGNRKATLDRLSIPRKYEVDFNVVKMPTLIMWGKEDHWIPLKQAYLMENAIPGSHLVVFDEAGHVPMEEIPTETVAEYLSFLGVEIRKDYLKGPNYLTHVH
ncbi:pimeloyl-ACP methyl ester carboxylesterase [Algoriphagus iocasae]|uniref:Pimeloyl-ACP methyl ester carboxylesterase n=1 Tax=Algoriphagus iocasae TaxID=1836499 RepID=A0A841MZV2_9BACT|nr:alpha/beta hydrolase [Algoriphagus iocasae]MBB6327985.1 pimeloyl-ACP methyl ester carboxylesterase [Algoriphagus iocasae]